LARCIVGSDAVKSGDSSTATTLATSSESDSIICIYLSEFTQEPERSAECFGGRQRAERDRSIGKGDDFQMNSSVLANKTAVVTGAASGIGLAIAAAMAEAGATVVLSDIREESVHRAAEDLRMRGLRAEGFAADASSEADLHRMFGHVETVYGRIDIVVNNAGMQYVANIEEFPVDKFRQMIDLMLVGPFLSMKRVIPVMKRQEFGRIINIASVNGLVGFAGKAAYNAAKHGLIGLTKVAALETAASGITVNALCPGYVDTPLVRGQLEQLAQNRGVPLENVLEEVIYPLVPQRRLLQPSEVADYAVFLASDMGRGITGQAVVIDGGYVAQ
jgi:3-hydroxybutyrate dehydrogenase